MEEKQKHIDIQETETKDDNIVKYTIKDSFSSEKSSSKKSPSYKSSHIPSFKANITYTK